MSVAKRATQKVDGIYPVIATGKPHHMTRKKQRIAWQLGYIKGFEEARSMMLHKHVEVKHDDAKTSEPTEVSVMLR